MVSARALIAGVLAALALAGCATPGGDVRQPTLQEVRDTACPVALGLVIGLQVEPAIDAATREGLARAQPLIESACAATATPAGLRAMSETVIPAVMGLILESTMTAEQKQAAVVAITTARLLILSLPVTPEATP